MLGSQLQITARLILGRRTGTLPSLGSVCPPPHWLRPSLGPPVAGATSWQQIPPPEDGARPVAARPQRRPGWLPAGRTTGCAGPGTGGRVTQPATRDARVASTVCARDARVTVETDPVGGRQQSRRVRPP